MNSEHLRGNKRNHAMAKGFKDAAKSLSKESDRGTVVLATAWLDESLTKILVKYLKPSNKHDDNLLGAGKPIGDFGTKIILAERLNLITPTIVKSLTIFRRLRNEFAHIASDLSFETPSVKDRVSLLLQENEELLIVMGQVCKDAGFDFYSCKDNAINLGHMIDSFGTKKLFQYTCGMLNSALAAIEHSLNKSDPRFTSDS